MKYKMIVLDVDGTLLTDEQTISARTRATLLKVQQMGVRVVLASGRPTHGVMPLARALELDKNGGFVLSYNGAQIIHVPTGERVFERRIDPQFMAYLERGARKRGFTIFTYREDRIVTSNAGNAHVQHEARLSGMRVEEAANWAEAVDFSPCKVMLVSDDEAALVGLEEHWRRRLAGVLDVLRSEDYYLEVVSESVDKSNTLTVLLEKEGIDPTDVVAIGDGVRDVPMLQLAGLGVAMGNAQDSVKACADVVTLTNAEIRDTAIPLDKLNESGRHALMGNLGIQYTYAAKGRVEATMPVDERTRQPFGILHGGASLALAETVAGLGSMILCQPDEMMVGMQVSGNHVSSAHEGDTVRAVATVIHQGRSSHVWDVNIYTSTDKLVSSVRVVNSVMKKR